MSEGVREGGRERVREGGREGGREGRGERVREIVHVYIQSPLYTIPLCVALWPCGGGSDLQNTQKQRLPGSHARGVNIATVTHP